MMPPPPKVWPVRPVSVLELVAAVVDGVPNVEEVVDVVVVEEEGVSPLPPPLGPVPAMVEAEPARGWPKKPIAVGALFCPKRMGFQSSLPVMGSMYFLRRKRISVVLTSASRLGG